MAPLVGYCCCGCTLRTGSLIIGWFQLISGIFYVCVFTTLWGKVTQQISKDMNLEEGSLDKSVFNLFNIIIIMIVAIGILASILATLLLIGIYKEKASLIFSWVIINITFLVLQVVSDTIVLFGLNDLSRVSGYFCACITAYFILVVYSYYVTIKESRRSATPHQGVYETESSSAAVALALPPSYSQIIKEKPPLDEFH